MANFAGADATPADSLASRCTELRRLGRYADAAGIAELRLRQLESESDAAAWEVGDARRLLAHLRRVSELGMDDQRALAAADSTEPTIVNCFEQGDFERMAALAERQLSVRRRILGEREFDVAESWQVLGLALDHLGRLEEAESAMNSAAQVQAALLPPLHPTRSTVANNLGHVYQQQGRFLDAERLYRQALEIDRQLAGAKSEQVAIAENNLGNLLRDMGHYPEALRLLGSSLRTMRELHGDDDASAVSVLGNVGVCLRAMGEWSAAERAYREVLVRRRALLGEEHPLVAQSLNNVGFTLQYQGDYSNAEQMYRDALRIYEARLGPDHIEVGRCNNNLGGLYSAVGREQEAVQHYRAAVRIWSAGLGNGHPLTAQAQGNLADRLRQMRRFPEADSLLAASITTLRDSRGDSHPLVAVYLSAQGRLREDQGDWAGAARMFEAALAIQREALTTSHPLTLASLMELGRLRRRAGDLDGAQRLLEEAARGYEPARLRMNLDASRASIVPSPHAELAAVRLARGQAAAAWESAERGRGRLLADLMLAADRPFLDQAERSALDSLRRTVSDLERQRDVLTRLEQPHVDSTVATLRDHLLLRLLQAQDAVGQMEQTLAARHPVETGAGMRLARIQATLPSDMGILGWLEVAAGAEGGAQQLWVYVVRKEGTVKWSRCPPATAGEDLAAQCVAYLTEILTTAGAFQSRDELDVLAARLYVRLVGPAERELRGLTRIAVMPCASMLGLPMESLRTADGTLFGDRFELVYCPSATILSELLQRGRTAGQSPPAEWHALVVGNPAMPSPGLDVPQDALALDRRLRAGNPRALSQLPPLPGAQREAELLRRHLGSKALMLSGAEASESRVVELAPRLEQYQLLHFATHAIADDERPDNSALVLSQVDLPDPIDILTPGARPFDGRWTAREILLEARLDAELVVLSGCGTALGQRVAGEGYLGLASAFLAAGGHNLLLTLWDVDDEAASRLMAAFYDQLLGAGAVDLPPGRQSRPRSPAARLTPATALQRAKSQLRQFTDGDSHPYEHPRYWAGFILVGSGQ